MDDKTQEQLQYDNAVIQVRDTIREMKAEGHDFSQKGQRTAFKKKLVDLTKKVSQDKRIWK